jgi:hypothetical protein
MLADAALPSDASARIGRSSDLFATGTEFEPGKKCADDHHGAGDDSNEGTSTDRRSWRWRETTGRHGWQRSLLARCLLSLL